METDAFALTKYCYCDSDLMILAAIVKLQPWVPAAPKSLKEIPTRAHTL